jgi:hypothetical protein
MLLFLGTTRELKVAHGQGHRLDITCNSKKKQLIVDHHII